MNDESESNASAGTLCEGNCVVCRDPLDGDRQKVHKKGIDTLIRVSSLRGDDALNEYLQEKSSRSIIHNVYVHKRKRCRIDYTRDPERDLQRAKDNNESTCSTAKRLRSSLGVFNWIEDCFICGKSAINDHRHPNREPVSMVTLLEFREAMLKQCNKRDDSLSHNVLTRLKSCIDLVAVEARYHVKCYTEFYYPFKGVVTGRPPDASMQKWFGSLCHYLDGECETQQLTVAAIHQKMKDLAVGEEVYGTKRLREKLLEHYGDHMFWSRIKGGRDDVLCFQNMVSYIVHDKWHSENIDNAHLEAERIVLTCAKLLKEEIREREYSKDHYPSTFDISDVDEGRQFLTPLTRIFIEAMIKDDIKRNSIGQAFTQAVRPTSIVSPIMFGTSVEMDHVFGSKWLIDELFKLGFSMSYDELTLYKQSILQEENLCTFTPPPDAELTHWAADNADHGVKSIDGRNQFHGMGIISMSDVKGYRMNTDHLANVEQG